jgi:hypothetical protein
LVLLPSFLHWKLSWSPSNKQSDWFSFSKFSPLTIIMDLACKNRLTYLPWWFKVHCGCAPIPCASRALQLCLQHHSDYYYASKFYEPSTTKSILQQNFKISTMQSILQWV